MGQPTRETCSGVGCGAVRPPVKRSEVIWAAVKRGAENREGYVDLSTHHHSLIIGHEAGLVGPGGPLWFEASRATVIGVELGCSV